MKIGDKVICIDSRCSGGLQLGELYKIQECQGSAWVVVNDTQYSVLRFKIYEEKQMFDMKKDKWFIRTPTPEISEIVQRWLFSQGFVWQHFKNTEINCTESKFLKLSPFEDNAFCHTMSINPKYDKSKEVKLSFLTTTVIDKVEYPQVKSPAQAELEALQQKIKELETQAQKLQELINK